MLSSAASVAITLILSAHSSQLTGAEAEAWKRIEPNVVRVMSGTNVVGAGVLIDSQGNFLAHRSVTVSPVLFGRLATGETLQLTVASSDDVTQLVLLHAEGWKPVGRLPVSVKNATSTNLQKISQISTKVLLVTGKSVVRGEVSQSNLVGVVAPSRRGVTLSEIRFEDPGTQYGGGLLFSLDGKLVGVLGASLDAESSKERSMPPTVAGLSGGGGTVFGAFSSDSAQNKSYGPGSLTVGYSVTSDVIARVVEGFLSPSKQVGHPALGIMCQDSRSGGAYIVSVTAGGPAQQAGLRPGDVILEIAGAKVQNQLEYTRVLVRQSVGEKIPVKVRRGDAEIDLIVLVGK